MASTTSPNSKAPCSSRHLGMEHHLQQQVAEFVAQVGQISALDRIRDLVGFLDRVGGDGREICSRSQGQPVPGVRSAAMISSNREMSEEGVTGNSASMPTS